MPRLDVEIPVPDGQSMGTLHIPEGNGPWPGVLVFPDAAGFRETFRELGDKMAALGYVALVPDIYRSYTAEQAELLDGALTSAGVDHTLEFYPARHGFAVPDNPAHDAEAEARHWEALRQLYQARLRDS